MDWAEAHYEVDFLKNVCFWPVYFFMCWSEKGVVFGNAVFVAILKKCEVENDADGF